MGAGLKKLLAYEGNVEEDYARTFSVDTLTPLGKRGTVDLVPNGSNIPVTSENRVEFVEKYVDYIFNTSIESSFNAFQEGLLSVLDGSGTSLFRPEELQELICGSPSLDFQVLEDSTIYDGYESDAPIIRYFPSVHDRSSTKISLVDNFGRLFMNSLMSKRSNCSFLLQDQIEFRLVV